MTLEAQTNSQPRKRSDASSQPCGLLRRLLIMVYDAAVVVALLMAATVGAMLAGFGGRTAMVDPAFTLYLALVWYLYLAWCWRRGMTLGMRAWRVRIENLQSRRPGWGACSIRFAVSLVSAAVLGAGFFWSLADGQKRSWHDIASKTRLLVREKKRAGRN